MHAVYTMPGEPGSFGGARRPFIGTLFDRRKAQRYLRTQDAYTLHRQAKRRFPRRKTHSKGIANLYQTDLVDQSSLSNFNNSYRYILTCIDVFTKRAWAIRLRRKTGREVTAAFRKVLATSDRNPRMLQTDKGTEFLNAAFQRMLAVNDIHWYSTEDIKASVVERFNRTLKTKMSRYFTYKNLPRYIDVLPRQIASYVSYHRSIGMSPNEVNANNEDHVRKRLFPPKNSAR